jgi:hypothetical protein
VLGAASELDRETYDQQIVPMTNISNIIENVLRISGNFDMAIIEADDKEAVEGFRKEVDVLNEQTLRICIQ